MVPDFLTIGRIVADETPQGVQVGGRAAPIVHVAPVAQDVAPAVVALFPRSLIGVSPQGWFRRRDPSGRVYPGPWRHAKQVLDRGDVVVASAEDYGPGR